MDSPQVGDALCGFPRGNRKPFHSSHFHSRRSPQKVLRCPPRHFMSAEERGVRGPNANFWGPGRMCSEHHLCARCVSARTRACTRTCSHTPPHTHIHAHTPSHTCACTHTCTHTHSHTNMHKSPCLEQECLRLAAGTGFRSRTWHCHLLSKEPLMVRDGKQGLLQS